MGHLSNPIGFRLTFEKKWNFNFFVKNIYYPEVINTLISLRDYIYYYLTRKKILQSGLCLSHFMVYKYSKKYYIKIYIYHIDLEKTAYDLINKFYHIYYETYNEISHKYDKNKTEKQVTLYHYLRDISNSDVFMVLFVFILFYRGINKKPNKYFWLNNLYIKNKKIINYYNLVFSTFFNQLLYIYMIINKAHKNRRLKLVLEIRNLKIKVINWIKHLKNINKLSNEWYTRNLAKLEKNIKIAKIKGLILYKAKKLIKRKPLNYHMVSKCKYLQNRVLNVIQNRIIKLAWQITKISIKKKLKNLNIIQENQLLQKALHQFKLKYKNYFWIYKFKKYKFLTIRKIHNIKKKFKNKMVKFNNILYDKAWRPHFITMLHNNVKFDEDNSKVDPFTLFFFLCKKTGFKKVKNTATLWKKWTAVLKYMQLFNDLNFLYKDYFFYNLNFFIFYIKTAIWHSIQMQKRVKYLHLNYFNLKDFIFSALQQGIYTTFFRKTLIWLNWFLKMGLIVIHNTCSLNKIQFDNIILRYFFIMNNNVTAPFIARYIVLKLKRGFTVVKTLNPLKRELIRVSKKSRNKAYTNILNNYVKKQHLLKLKYKKKVSCFVESASTFYDYFFSKFYVDNQIILTPNLFLFFLKFKDKLKKLELSFASIWRFNILRLFINKIYYKINFVLYKIYKIKKHLPIYIIKKIIKKYIKICNLKKVFNCIKNTLYINVTARHGIWLFFLSIFRFYENKKKRYRYYHKELKQNILKTYKKFVKFNKLLNIGAQLNKIKSNILDIKNDYSVYNKIYSSIFILCNNLILYKNKKKINNFKIAFNSFFNKYYLHFTMLKTLWNIFNKINFRNERDLYIPKYKSLIMGFKMVLKGRFSRKQRASKITLLKGKVPLNTFKMKVDYTFAHITLKNSEISLKFYLYKSKGFEIYKRTITI